MANVTAGELITYTLTVTNAGPQAATNVRLLELVPAGTTVVSLTPTNPDFSGEYCSLGGACFLGTVFLNTTATVEVVLQVNADYPGTTLINSAHVSADQRDPDMANNFNDATTPVLTSADLVIAKSDMVDPVLAGDTLQYQIVVTNTGPSDAQSVIITDSLDANTLFVGASPQCTESAGVLTCPVGTLTNGSVTSIFVEVRVDETLTDPTTLTNFAGVNSSTPDADTTNNNTSENTTVHQPDLNPTDLEISKSDSPDPVFAGQTLTYTLSVTNNGPAIASNVQVVDALPTGVTLISATPSQGLCNTGITCDLGDMPVGATVNIVVVVTVDADQLTDINNFARVPASNPDPIPGNNQDNEVTTVNEQADLSIVKTADPNPAVPGSQLSYEIVVSNSGPSDAQNVLVTETLPAELAGVSFSASQGACAANVCNLGTIPANGSATISILGTVSAAASSTFTNTADVDSTTPDPNLTDNTVDTPTPVQPSADLVLNVGSTPTINAGETLTITYTVVNLGPSDAVNTVVTATFPANVSAPAGWNPVGGGVYTRSLGTLPAGGTSTVTAVVTANDDIEPGSSLQFNGVTASDTPDPNLTNNTANADTSIIGIADLSLTKTGPATVVAGQQITYTILVSNSGPSVAQSVDVKDALPQGVSLELGLRRTLWLRPLRLRRRRLPGR